LTDKPLAVQVSELTRTFGGRAAAVTVLNGISLQVRYGEIVALLGVNGAGKTTLIKVLSTLLLPTSGSVRIAGHDVVRDPRLARQATSVVFGGDRGLYSRLTGRDNLRFFGMLAGLSRSQLQARIAAALETVNLVAVAGQRVETYSRGMRQRLHLAIGLVAQPRVLLLDEPTVGLDPVEAARLRDVVLDMRNEGTGILLTSHHLLDVEELANRVLLLSDGRIRKDLTLAEFVRQSGHAATVTVRGRDTPPNLEVARLPSIVVASSVRAEGASWVVELQLREWQADIFGILDNLFRAVTVEDVQVRETRLEEAFTALSAEVAI
jgi:ABC-2 type transport system ATP-binding protein